MLEGVDSLILRMLSIKGKVVYMIVEVGSYWVRFWCISFLRYFVILEVVFCNLCLFLVKFISGCELILFSFVCWLVSCIIL